LFRKASILVTNQVGTCFKDRPQVTDVQDGQSVFTNGKRYITPDVDGHKSKGWKVFDLRGRRVGTFDENLNRIGK